MAENNETQTAEALIRQMAQLQGCPCPECSGPLNAHEVLMSIAMGCRNSPRCLPCLAGTFARDVAFLRPLLMDYVQQRECYRIALQWANEHAEAGITSHSGEPLAVPTASQTHRPTPDTVANVEWDAGDMSCGDLVLELRLRLQAMGPGDTLKLCARDSGAPQDIPAWCRLTGHTLLQAQHPTYWIKRKE
jgi:tRNA 2-thiouridine synthesizing protein A